MIRRIDLLSASSSFVGYTYSYPHKTAHRRLSPSIPLAEAWQNEPRNSLFLYLHVPFCEHRCGFCNLFTLAAAKEEMTAAYLRQVRTQAGVFRNILPDAGFARVALGGGTPTFFDEPHLAESLDILEETMQADLPSVPISCEASPATLTPRKLRLLRDRGVDRLSLGVQSFDDGELRALGRAARAHDAQTAIEMTRAQEFPTLNVDLIYGIPGQTLDSWKETLRQTLAYRPEEIYLYPLYVREHTWLGDSGTAARDDRPAAYRLGREILLGSGYRQISFRMFRSEAAPDPGGPVYCCQSDGMIGLGCGARSYTRRLHYSSEYAVKRPGVRSILEAFVERDAASFASADHGIHLDEEDRRRRYAILSLLPVEGLSLQDYRQRFGGDIFEHLPQLSELIERGLADVHGDRFRLTESGIERSDVIGPWLYSRRVLRLMETYRWR